MVKKNKVLDCNQIRKTIKSMYKGRKRLYPSDVVSKTHCPYDQVEKVFKQLEREGFVKAGKH